MKNNNIRTVKDPIPEDAHFLDITDPVCEVCSGATEIYEQDQKGFYAPASCPECQGTGGDSITPHIKDRNSYKEYHGIK